jgi:hypothetical protein
MLYHHREIVDQEVRGTDDDWFIFSTGTLHGKFDAAQIVVRLDPHPGPVNVASRSGSIDVRTPFVISYQFAIDTPTAL